MQAFHLSAKFDSQTAKTISVLGLLFLPGTFVSVSEPYMSLKLK